MVVSDKKSMSFAAAVSLGVGTMIGAGIFALLGEAGSIAGSAVWLSFAVGGGIALLTGYSLGRLGARWPSAGGIVEYLIHSWGKGVFAGALSVMMYIAALVSLSLVAKTFGNYGAALVSGTPGWVAPVLAVAVIGVFVAVNLAGSSKVGRAELWIVMFKFAVLVALAIGGLTAIKPDLLAPSTYPSLGTVVGSVAVTFFAYEGFRVITNAAEDVPNPSRTIPRAIMVAILVVMALYILISIVVFGTLTADAVVAAKENALAEAARPVFGEFGFVAVSITAMVATASAINASLYSATNVTYQMAKEGQLPGTFGRPVAKTHEGLLVSGVIVAVLAVAFNLGQIAVLGAISILLVHTVVHVGHLRVIRETGANRVVVALAALASAAAIVLTLVNSSRTSWTIILTFAAFVGVAFGAELLLRAVHGKSVRPRLPFHSRVTPEG